MQYNPKRYHKKKPWEFKKKLAAWAIIIATLAAITSYALAADGMSIKTVYPGFKFFRNQSLHFAVPCLRR